MPTINVRRCPRVFRLVNSIHDNIIRNTTIPRRVSNQRHNRRDPQDLIVVATNAATSARHVPAQINRVETRRSRRRNGRVRPTIIMPPGSKVGVIEQEVIIHQATPPEVFEALMDEKQHAALTKGEARISRHIGGAFTTFDGWASGKQVELVPDKKIVQSWRAEDWPAGTVSMCTYTLSEVKDGTRIQFIQTDVPKAFVKSVAKGWNDFYWRPLKKIPASSGSK